MDDVERLKQEIKSGGFDPKAAAKKSLPKAGSQSAKDEPEADADARVREVLDSSPAEEYVGVDVRIVINAETLHALNEYCRHEGFKQDKFISKIVEDGFWDQVNAGRKRLGLPPGGPNVRLAAWVERLARALDPKHGGEGTEEVTKILKIKFRAAETDAGHI
jgi:hypothetical protein